MTKCINYIILVNKGVFYEKIFLLVFLILTTVNIYTQEMQLSGGFEAGFGALIIDNNFWYNDKDNYNFCSEDTNTVYFAPGISFTLRVFSDIDNAISTGLIFRDRAIFMTNMKQVGTFGINNISYPISETYSISDDLFLSIMDFGLGSTNRFRISDWFNFYTDLGVSFTMMDLEDDKAKETLNYLGIGIFSDLAFQINFTPKLYLELGLNGIINIFSSQKGTFQITNKKFEYEDSGRWDLVSVAAYIQIGWRFDLKQIK